MLESKKIVMHIIPSLGSGGAERMLLRIANNDTKYNHIVIIILKIDRESIFYNINSDTVTLLSLGFSGITNLLYSTRKYLYYLDKYSPDIIQTWMYHANLFGGVLAYIKGYRNIFWNIRSAEVSVKKMKLRTLMFVMLGGLFSHFIPRSIISCSKRAIGVHKKLFYSQSRFIYIPNGIDNSFVLEKKSTINKKPVIGFVARLDAQKNHENFLKSLKHINLPVKFFLIGHNVKAINLSEYNVDKINVNLLDETSDIFSYYDSFDFLILPSIYGEAFPNVLIEALSRGVVCISSDVGDSLSIISSSGYIISDPSSPVSIANAINSAVNDFKHDHSIYLSKSKEAISLVKSKYRLKEIVSKYHNVWFPK
jgi:glycosyltransferase involved in cell wall biosynthesis